MRQLNKKTWPYKIKVENFNDKDHDDFLRTYPNVIMEIVERNSRYYDIYFQQEKDLILYRLCI
jgi:hypothetical protein